MIKHEVQDKWVYTLIFALSVSVMLGLCIAIYPSMAKTMVDVSQVFSDMGAFSQAFGMDQLNFGEFMGFYSIECGNILGIGGAIFASILGITMISKEESQHTIAFLLAHPISRVSILICKWCAMMLLWLLFNGICFMISYGVSMLVCVTLDWQAFVLLHYSNALVQLVLLHLCFGLSCLTSRPNYGLALGVSLFTYFLNIICNLNQDYVSLGYFTPFKISDGASILNHQAIDYSYLLGSGLITLAIVIIGFVYYLKKDLR